MDDKDLEKKIEQSRLKNKVQNNSLKGSMTSHDKLSGLNNNIGGIKPPIPGLNKMSPVGPGMGQNGSLSENEGLTNENETQKSGSEMLKDSFKNTANKTKAIAGGAASGKGSAVSKAKKIKLLIKLAPVIGYVLMGLAALLLIYCVIMIPVIVIGERLEEVKEGVISFTDKYTNFISGDGFTTSSDVVKNKLKDAQDKYEDGSYKHTMEFDEGILISSVNFNNFVDLNVYDEPNSEMGDKEYSSSQKDTYTSDIDKKETRSYYTVQSMFLGSSDFDKETDAGLIYHLVDYRITWDCSTDTNDLDDYFDTISGIVKLSFSRFDANFVSAIDIIPALSGMFRDINASSQEGIDYWQYMVDRNVFQSDDLEKKNVLLNIFSSQPPVCDKENEEDEQPHAVPRVVRYINYDNYLKYLKEVYIKSIYFDCDECKKKEYSDEYKKNFTKELIRQIVYQRNAYYEAKNEDNKLIVIEDDKGELHANLSLTGYIGSIPVGSKGLDWKQGSGSPWANIQLGTKDRTTMAWIGCYVTSIAISMANSGTQINAPYFDPGVLAEHLLQRNSFSAGGSLQAHNWQELAPNFVLNDAVFTSDWSYNQIEAKAKESLANGYALVVQVYGGGHFVAAVGIENGEVIISDPAGHGPDGKISDHLYKLSDFKSTSRGGITSLRIFES